MKIFCYSCGSKIEYAAANKQKFCMNCGAALDPSNASKKDEKVEQDDLDSEEVSFSGNISKLDFDVSIPKKQNLSQVMGSRASNSSEFGPRGTEDKISKEDFLKQYSNEAGAKSSRDN